MKLYAFIGRDFGTYNFCVMSDSLENAINACVEKWRSYHQAELDRTVAGWRNNGFINTNPLHCQNTIRHLESRRDSYTKESFNDKDYDIQILDANQAADWTENA